MNPEPTKHFRSLPFLIVAFIILLSFSCWYYVRGGFQSYSKTESTIITEYVEDLVPTLHWKTYKNEQFKFEIKYPPHWEESLIVVPEGTVTFSASGWRMFSLYPITKDDWFECDKLNKESTQDVPELGCHMNFIAEKDSVYVWSHPQDYPDELKNDVDSIPQVISTFKFIDSTLETSDWKTYKNEEYGFEFKYPKSYTDFKNGLIDLSPEAKEYYKDYKINIRSESSQKDQDVLIVGVKPLKDYVFNNQRGGDYKYDVVKDTCTYTETFKEDPQNSTQWSTTTSGMIIGGKKACLIRSGEASESISGYVIPNTSKAVMIEFIAGDWVEDDHIKTILNSFKFTN